MERSDRNRLRPSNAGAASRAIDGFAHRVLGGLVVVCLLGVGVLAPSALADPGGVFVTGHDSDGHAQADLNNRLGAQHIIQRSIAYVTHDAPSPSLLLVTDREPCSDGCSPYDPAQGMFQSGFTTFDIADYGSGTFGVLDLHTVDFTNYDAVVVASDWGGWLWQRELDILNARAGELANYVNAGGGLVAFAESGHEMTQGGTTQNQFAFVPFVFSSTQVDQLNSNQLTPAGEAMGLTTEDVNGNFSHNIFASTGGMDVIDFDSNQRAISLATRQPIVPAGRIVVRKDAVPNHSQNFSFTAAGSVSPTSFQLDDDSDPGALEHHHSLGSRRRWLLHLRDSSGGLGTGQRDLRRR